MKNIEQFQRFCKKLPKDTASLLYIEFCDEEYKDKTVTKDDIIECLSRVNDKLYDDIEKLKDELYEKKQLSERLDIDEIVFHLQFNILKI